MNIRSTIMVLAAAAFLSLAFAGPSLAADLGSITTFNVQREFEASENQRVEAVLVKTSSSLYFYVEKNWWNSQVSAKQNEISGKLDALAVEFSNHIYPTLTSVYGSEWNPGVDGDPKITVLFHAMKEGVAGYFRSADEYIKLQVPDSNEREMVYLSLANIESSQLKGFLAHEFTHVITFNQKDRLGGAAEEVWLNEARADFATTILGYDIAYDGSNLQRRVRDFLGNPSDSVTEWQEKKYDYASASLFMHYLVDHYGIDILSDSLKLKSKGITSLNEILARNGYKENFAQIFTNWTIANVINDCSVDNRYCYLTASLKNVRISPTLNFLPLSGNSSLTVTNVTKHWAGNWQKIIGGGAGDLTLEFSASAPVNFKIPYVLSGKDNTYTVDFLVLDKNQKGKLTVLDFGEKYHSLVIAPSLQGKISGFSGIEFTYPYTFKASIFGQVTEEDPALIEQLLAQIESLKQQIAVLQGNRPQISCSSLNSNLYIGLSSNNVTCLQEFLRSQGPAVYPEALVTGFFGNLTRSAVMRFQQAHGILTTGFVGVLTRAKINTLLPK